MTPFVTLPLRNRTLAGTFELTPQKHVLRNLALAILAATLICSGLLIWIGEKPRTEYWATYATMEAKPSLEIIP